MSFSYHFTIIRMPFNTNGENNNPGNLPTENISCMILCKIGTIWENDITVKFLWRALKSVLIHSNEYPVRAALLEPELFLHPEPEELPHL